jgi:hypothetical protein
MIDNYLKNCNIGIRFWGSFNCEMRDTQIYSSTTYDIVSATITYVPNNTLINTTFTSTSVEAGTLYVKWYLDAYVNDSDGVVEGATVNAYDINNSLAFTDTTDASGIISRQNVTEFYENVEKKYYLTNYSINATDGNFWSNTTEQVNLTTNFIDENKIVLTLQKPPYLDMSLISPSDTLLVREGETFSINVSVTCKEDNCGAFNLTPRYNELLIPENIGDIYVLNGTQVQNCTLNKDETCYRDWTVYTTNVGTWDIDVNATPYENETSDVTVSVYRVIIVTEVVDRVGGGWRARAVKEEPLLDLEILNLTTKVIAGDKVKYRINLTNVGDIIVFDVIMHKRIIKDGKILVEDTVTRSMTSGLIVEDFLDVPKDFDIGRYFFEIDVEYVEKNASALMVFYVVKDCVTITGLNYDLSKDRYVIYTEELDNIELKFRNKCDIRLTDTFLMIDNSKIDLGNVPPEDFETRINFDRYGDYDLLLRYNEGYSTINISIIKRQIINWIYFLWALAAIAAIAVIIIVSINIKKILLLKQGFKISLPIIPSGISNIFKFLKPYSFKERLKDEIIKKLEEKIEGG